MLTSTTNKNTNLVKVVFSCHSKADAISLLTILRGLHQSPAVYIRHGDVLIAYIPFNFAVLLQACRRPDHAHTVRYFKVDDSYCDFVIDYERENNGSC